MTNKNLKAETVKKYLTALRELCYNLEVRKQNKIALLIFVKDKGLSSNAAHKLVHLGFVRNLGCKGSGRFYVWNTTQPNEKMAAQLITSCNNVAKRSMQKSRELNVIKLQEVKQEKPILENPISEKKLAEKTLSELIVSAFPERSLYELQEAIYKLIK